MPNVETYDFDALTKALAELAEAATTTRVAIICDDHDAARTELHKAISALAKAVHQLSLLNNK